MVSLPRALRIIQRHSPHSYSASLLYALLSFFHTLQLNGQFHYQVKGYFLRNRLSWRVTYSAVSEIEVLAFVCACSRRFRSFEVWSVSPHVTQIQVNHIGPDREKSISLMFWQIEGEKMTPHSMRVSCEIASHGSWAIFDVAFNTLYAWPVHHLATWFSRLLYI